MKKIIISTLIFSLCLNCLYAGNWPAWRGTDAKGSTDSGNYPTELNLKKNLLWKASLPDKGCSTPIVWKGSIFLTCPINGEDGVLSFSITGEKNWQTKIGPQRKGKHLNGSGSNPSLITDGQNLYALFKSGNLACLNWDGEILWQKDLSSYGKDTLYWDFGTSPILSSNYLIVALMRKGNSWLLAFDPSSGEVAWKKERNYQTPPECDHSYATPTLIKHKGKEAILVWGAERLSAHSAEDGEMHWVSTGFNPKQKKNWVVVGSQVVTGDIAIVPYVGVRISPEFGWEGRGMSPKLIVYGRGPTLAVLCPVRQSRMEKFIYYGIVEKCTVSIQRRERVSGRTPFRGQVRVITDLPRLRVLNYTLPAKTG